MQKLLFIAPHLSTGGLPQYLCKKIELLKDSFDIYLVEWVDCTGGVLVVTRNKITQLIVPEKFYTLNEDKHQLIKIINNIQPDIIHLEEIPEFFMDPIITKQIYTQDRKYKIIETSHDSSYNTNNKQFFPDKFMFVSDWQIQQYKDLDIPKVLVEYPIEYVERPNREEALQALGLDPNKKHILHVGLYTSRKNQAEFFKYAKAFPEYEFHSLGNRADNFKWYWEPLAKEQPSNLTWWNERTDVDKFYQSMDLFLFTSKGNNNDKETMPLVIREAISYQIPILIYNLPVYLNYFDKFDKINYLEFDDFDQNCNLISSTLNTKPLTTLEEEAIVISTFPISNSIIQTTKECIEAAKLTGRKIILTSHFPIPEELQKEVDYCLYDKNNILTKHTFYSIFTGNYDDYDVFINLRGNNNDVYHGPTVYTNYYNGASLAKHVGIKKLYYLNYDYIIKDKQILDDISFILNKKEAYCLQNQGNEGKQLITYFWAINTDFLLNNLPFIKNDEEYDNLMNLWESESNSLENLIYNKFKDKNNIHWIHESETQHFFEHKDYSRVEYFTVLPVNKENTFAPYVRISNSKDSKIINITVYENTSLIFEEKIKVNSKLEYYKLIEYNPDNFYDIKFQVFDEEINKLVDEKNLTLDNLHNNGTLTIK